MQASAVPEELRRFRSRSRQLAGELDASLARLSEALADFRQAPSDVAVSLGPLEGDVARWAGEANRLGAWVGEVGDAFAAADASARPEVVRVGDEAALMVGPTPAELRPPPLLGLLGLLDLDPSPWVEAHFPALAARRRPAHARLAELHARRRDAAVADYVGSAATSDRFGPTAEAVAGDIAAATAASRATPAEVAAFVALLDRHAALGLAREVAEVLRRADARLRPAERRYLRAALAPLRIRLDAEWPTVVFSTECATPRPRPAGLDAALAVLAVPDPPRRTANVAEGLANGMVVGAFDEEGYDNGWGEAARVVGQLVSGYLVYGDVRDAGAHLSRGQWGDSVWDSLGLVPGLGDVWMTGRMGGRLADGSRGLPRVEEALGDIGRLDGLHAQPLRIRTDASRRAMEALRSGHDGTQLEGHVALLIGDDVVDFKRTAWDGQRVVGEVDVETADFIVEVTLASRSKEGQIRKFLTNPYLNPSGKQVIVFAPEFKINSGRALEALGIQVVRTERELMAVLRMPPSVPVVTP